MENLSTVRIDLGISAKKIASQIMIENERIETQLAKGIELGINEMMEEDNFVELIKESTKREIGKIMDQTILSFEFRNKMEKKIQEKFQEKIDLYADEVAEKLTQSL